jgi:molybdopterin-synthase adenylyltransferase
MAGLSELAYPINYFGELQLVIEDTALLDWGRAHDMTPANVQLEALQQGIIPLRYLKNLHALKPIEQKRICSSKVLVCGCGGLGGILVQLLARAGVGFMRLVDGDTFSSTNLNRQLLSESQNLSQPKAQVAAERVRWINPLTQVEACHVMIGPENVQKLMEDADLVLDALDNLRGRFILADAAGDTGIPFIHAAVAGWWGQISTFLPGSELSLKSIYGERQSRDAAEEATGVLGPTAAVVGSLEALEAIRLLSGRKPAYSRKLLYFDGESGETQIIPL